MVEKSKTKENGKTLAVVFGGATRQVKGRRINVSVRRDNVGACGEDLVILDELITNAQVAATLAYDPNAKKDAEGQQVMPLASPTIEPLNVICDVSGFTVRDNEFRFGLGLPMDISAAHLDEFSFKVGKLSLERIGNATNEVEGDAE